MEATLTAPMPSMPMTESPDFTLTLTDKAVEKVKAFAAANPAAEGKCLRVYIHGGGCSGFQYGFAFDDRRPTDTIVSQSGLDVLVDPQSTGYLGGATVDFVDDFRGSGFIVQNPNAKSTCGCGHSFQA